MNDHNPPHFHAEYAGFKALIDIQNGYVIGGALPNRQLKYVLAWADMHQDEQVFREKLTVMNHAVAWDLEGNRDATKCIDIDPCTMYETSKIVKDPLMYA